ncbi:hypothetical protein CTI12_AA195220 [Artemisia annua]|uniref:Uncharacterized protein n=1 Tax=Artemisia annua TaxID=35608 RepID=A0A2U1P4C0_ARTAN|nr:hypothetical protein CTI12_AA195220 [Artemisia annua]
MVDSVPLFVMSWNAEMGMKKADPVKMPLWVKMVNVPMEAWSMDGISAMASSPGTPILMDNMTTHMCQFGVGRPDYARVLIEFGATKNLKKCINIQYTHKEQNVRGTKEVKVEYDWKPMVCTYCRVFGHFVERSNIRQRIVERRSN